MTDVQMNLLIVCFKYNFTHTRPSIESNFPADFRGPGVITGAKGQTDRRGR